MGAMAAAKSCDAFATRLRVGDDHRAVDRCRAVACRCQSKSGKKGRGIGVGLAERRVQLVAQAQVQRQVGRDLPVVLGEEGVGVAEAVHGGLVGVLTSV